MDVGLKKDCNTVDDNEGYCLNKKQLKCIELLLEGELPTTKIAEIIGVDRRTISRWKKDKRFSAELQECTNETKRQAQHYIDSRTLLAVKKLWALTDSGDVRTKEKAIIEWINRSLGKPQQIVTVANGGDNQTDFDIQAELAKMEDEDNKPLVSLIPFEKIS